jgi:hypothetical protein
MAVVPLYNPNVFREHQPFHWRNRAVTDSYEPGSTVKAFLLAAALDSGLLSPETKFFCEHGEYKVGRKTIRDHERKGYGFLTVDEIITYSSNIGAVKIGEKIGYKRFIEYLKRFGFGEKTGIELPGEREGFVRPLEEAKEIDKATTYFGQGMTANSLQLAMAYGGDSQRGKAHETLPGEGNQGTRRKGAREDGAPRGEKGPLCGGCAAINNDSGKCGGRDGHRLSGRHQRLSGCRKNGNGPESGSGYATLLGQELHGAFCWIHPCGQTPDAHGGGGG